jgi:hypothetical protein
MKRIKQKIKEFFKEIFKNITWLIHILISIFMVVGFLMPDSFLFYYLLSWPCVYLQWQLNNNNCILTQIEYYLDGKTLPPGNKYEFPFLKKQFASIGIKLNDMQLYYFTTYGHTVFWIIGFIRYMYYRIYKK